MNSLITTIEISPIEELPVKNIFNENFDVMTGYRNYYKLDFPEVKFGSDVWDITKAPNRPGYLIDRQLKYDWSVITHDNSKALCKQLLVAFFNPNHPELLSIPGRRISPMPFVSVLSKVALWNRWLKWLDSENLNLSEITQKDCDRHLLYAGKDMSASGKSKIVTSIRDFSVYGKILSEKYNPTFIPWGYKTASRVANRKVSKINSTPWIPDEVFDPLLATSLFLIEKASKDILAARKEYAETFKEQSYAKANIEEKLPHILNKYKDAGIKLPPATGQHSKKPLLSEINLHWIGKQSSLDLHIDRMDKEFIELLEEATLKIGVGTEKALFHVPSIVSLPNGEEAKWRDSFSVERLQQDLNDLVAACFTVIAGLSGMRSSEILELEKDCISITQDNDSHSRYQLKGKVLKGKNYGGIECQWTVIEPVAKAVELLIKMDILNKNNKLFNTDLNRLSKHNDPFKDLPINVLLKSFVRKQPNWAEQAGLQPIPLVNGSSWNIVTSHFRRTLARQLAYRPHGTIASKVHLKHISAHVTEGYWGPAGESADLFLKEVEEQEKEAKLKHLEKQFKDWQDDKNIVGGASKKLIEDFTYIQKELENFSGTVEQNSRRLLMLLKQRSSTLHIGMLNDCHFTDPSKARCLKNSKVENPTGPNIMMCEPSKCANAILTEEHLPNWERPLLQIENLIKDPKVPKLEKERLRKEETRLNSVVQSITTKKEKK